MHEELGTPQRLGNWREWRRRTSSWDWWNDTFWLHCQKQHSPHFHPLHPFQSFTLWGWSVSSKLWDSLNSGASSGWMTARLLPLWGGYRICSARFWNPSALKCSVSWSSPCFILLKVQMICNGWFLSQKLCFYGNCSLEFVAHGTYLSSHTNLNHFEYLCTSLKNSADLLHLQTSNSWTRLLSDSIGIPLLNGLLVFLFLSTFDSYLEVRLLLNSIDCTFVDHNVLLFQLCNYKCAPSEMKIASWDLYKLTKLVKYWSSIWC